MTSTSAATLAFDRVSMEFPGVKALQEVSFAVSPGSVHALMGENGAGKSTLLKILSGAYRPTAGTVVIDGEARAFPDTGAALAAGVAVIYQELHLVPEMSVAENLFLGHLPQRGGFVKRAALFDAARAQLDLIGEAIDPGTKVGRLPLAQRQMVEIAKALTRGARIIAFDEPTSSLSDSRGSAAVHDHPRTESARLRHPLRFRIAWMRSLPCATASRFCAMANTWKPRRWTR